MDKDLECPETFRQKNEKDELIIDFDIPYSLEKLEDKGYIHDEKILIKASIIQDAKWFSLVWCSFSLMMNSED